MSEKGETGGKGKTSEKRETGGKGKKRSTWLKSDSKG